MRLVSLVVLILGQSLVLAGPFTVTSTPVKDGVRATADLPASQHHRNVGGSDGAGLCVYTSAWHAALWQSVSDLYGFRDWMTRRPGGSYPQKFESTLNAYCKERGIPAPAYVQHTGGDVEFLELALKTGRIVCVTYCGVDGSGRYGNEVIAHMVNLVHLDKDRAAIVDNNFPGTWLWMSREDFIGRWKGVKANGQPYYAGRQQIGGGWAIVLLNAPPAPYPDAPGVQSLPVTASKEGCVCGDSCACKDGDCPAKCPVVVGQCSNGRCPVPQQSAVPFSPARASGAGYWSPHVNGREWYFWEGNRVKAVAFADGRVEGADANGNANGVTAFPPAPLPAGIVTQVPQAMPEKPIGATHDPFPPGGVIPDKLTERTTYRHNGEESTREQVFAALSLTDDSERWNLTIVGEPNFATKVREDIAKLPSLAREKIHVQSYAATDWPVSQFRLGQGVTLRKPAVGRVGADVGTVPVADYNAGKLTELITSEQGPTPAPKPVKPVNPNAPTVPNTPIQQPANGGLILLGVVAALVYLILRK